MAETIALAKLVVKIKHSRALMHDLQVRQNQETQIESTIVWVDNTAALAVATGSDFTMRLLARYSPGPVHSEVCTAHDCQNLVCSYVEEHFRHDD